VLSSLTLTHNYLPEVSGQIYVHRIEWSPRRYFFISVNLLTHRYSSFDFGFADRRKFLSQFDGPTSIFIRSGNNFFIQPSLLPLGSGGRKTFLITRDWLLTFVALGWTLVNVTVVSASNEFTKLGCPIDRDNNRISYIIAVEQEVLSLSRLHHCAKNIFHMWYVL